MRVTWSFIPRRSNVRESFLKKYITRNGMFGIKIVAQLFLVAFYIWSTTSLENNVSNSWIMRINIYDLYMTSEIQIKRAISTWFSESSSQSFIVLDNLIFLSRLVVWRIFAIRRKSDPFWTVFQQLLLHLEGKFFCSRILIVWCYESYSPKVVILLNHVEHAKRWPLSVPLIHSCITNCVCRRTLTS